MTETAFSLHDVASANWPELIACFRDAEFEQSLTYTKAAAERVGARLRLVSINRGGASVAAAALRIKTLPLFGRGIAWLPSGPVTRTGAAVPDEQTQIAILSALRKQFAEKEGHVLRLRMPGAAFCEPAEFSRIAHMAGFSKTSHTPYCSYAIDLDKDDDALMAQFKGKWRTDLRYALRSDLTLEQGNSPDLQTRFLSLFQQTQQDKGFQPDITPQFHFALAGPDMRHQILIARKDNQDIAGIVIGICGSSAVYLFGATSDAGRQVRAGYFLTWQGISLARAQGAAWYDLGGIDAVANPDVARFKERMNGSYIDAPVFEALPGGLSSTVIKSAEYIYQRLKGRRAG